MYTSVIEFTWSDLPSPFVVSVCCSKMGCSYPCSLGSVCRSLTQTLSDCKCQWLYLLPSELAQSFRLEKGQREWAANGSGNVKEQGRRAGGLRGGALDPVLFLVLLETTPHTPALPALQLVTTFCQFYPHTASAFSHLAISGAWILGFSYNLLESFQWCLITYWISLNLPICIQQPRPGPRPLSQARIAFPCGCLHTITTAIRFTLSLPQTPTVILHLPLECPGTLFYGLIFFTVSILSDGLWLYSFFFFFFFQIVPFTKQKLSK